jgi:phosphatidate cytidylyltransferase
MRRIWTSTVLTALLFAGLFIHSSFWLAFIVFFGTGGAIEFSNIHFKGRLPALSVLVIIATVVFPANAYGRAMNIFSLPDSILIAAFFVLASVLFIFSSGKVSDFKISVPMALFGIVWIGYLFSFNIYVYFIRVDGYLYGIQAVFLFAYLVCGNDIGAYYIGSTFGKNRLSELYSPKKTWEGFYGGIVSSMAVGVLCHYTFAGQIPLYHILIMAIIISLSGTLGDLIESVFKRSYQVKDAGEILPGHGGILDRADSILLATPVYYWYLHYVIMS